MANKVGDTSIKGFFSTLIWPPRRVAASLATRRPHRTVLGELHHTAPGGRFSQKVRIQVMDDPRPWQEPIEAIPRHAASLATSIEPFEQKPATRI